MPVHRDLFLQPECAIIAPMRLQTLALTAASLLLAVGTVLVFIAFDSHSHSTSDTIRPFIVTMVPIWAAFGLTVWVAVRAGSGRRDGD